MSRRIIFVSIMRLTDRVARDWFIDDLVADGEDVQYWDVVEALREPHDEVGAIAPDYLRVYRTMAEVDAACQRPENAGALYVMLISFTHQFIPIYRLFTRRGVAMGYIAWGAMPTSPEPIWRKALASLTSPWWLATVLVRTLQMKALRRFGLVAPFEVKFAAGRVALASGGDSRRMVPINAVDYDRYLATLPTDVPSFEPPYAVFLDINLPYQSDLGLTGLRPVHAERYFASLTAYFDRLERAAGLRVVIAAHPKAGYPGDRFGDRSIVRGRTAELVRHAALVLSHTSTSVSYAVLNETPLVFLYTTEMARLYENTVMRELRNFARYLGAPLENTDDPATPAAGVPAVDAARYLSYRYDFLTSPQSERTATRAIFRATLADAAAPRVRPFLTPTT